jgi:hypothetical protein
MKRKTYSVYKFNELSVKAKEKAINDYIEFELEVFDEHSPDYVKKAVAKAEQMQTPWFAGSYVFDYSDNGRQIIENIKINNYDFLKDGRIDPRL